MKAKLCSAICNVNFVSSGEGTCVIVSGQKDASLTLSTEVDKSRGKIVIGLDAGNVEGCLSEMGEVSVAVSKRLDNCRKEMNLVNSPLVDKSPLSVKFLIYNHL